MQTGGVNSQNPNAITSVTTYLFNWATLVGLPAGRFYSILKRGPNDQFDLRSREFGVQLLRDVKSR